MDPSLVAPTTNSLIAEWRASLTERERRLHDLAAVKLKKVLVTSPSDDDQGSYFPEFSHAFKAWLAQRR